MGRHANDRRDFRLLLGIILSLGFGCLAFAIWHTLQIRACSRWPRVQATVIRLSVASRTNVLGHNKWRPISVSSDIDFRYAYEVGGRQFESARFFFLPGYPSANELQARYPVGTHFRAFLHPADPSLAIVEPESISYRAFGIGIALLSLWGIMLKAHRRPDQRTSVRRSSRRLGDENLASTRF
jgi:hypothetical protein